MQYANDDVFSYLCEKKLNVFKDEILNKQIIKTYDKLSIWLVPLVLFRIVVVVANFCWRFLPVKFYFRNFLSLDTPTHPCTHIYI